MGAKDGVLLSGLAIDDNDSLARRDQGLEFLTVTPQVKVELSSSVGRQDTWLISNTSNSVIDTHLLVIVTGLRNTTHAIATSSVCLHMKQYGRRS